MSKFEVLIEQVKNVRDHPNADRLSLIDIKGFTCISGKLEDGSHRYRDGDPVAYIPEGSVLPEWLLKAMDFWNEEKQIGTLNGKNGDRIKAMRLRGILSQGVVYPCCGITAEDGTHFRKWMRMADGEIHKVGVGWDVAEDLGITKYEPPIPASMGGEVFSHCYDLIYNFDVENAQKFEGVFEDHDIVGITEKLHGTFTGMIFTYEQREDFLEVAVGDKKFYATAYSKGLGEKGLCFKATEENLSKNLYLRSLQEFIKNLGDNLEWFFDNIVNQNTHVVIMGETYGQGIQDLNYSTPPKFSAFDIELGDCIVDHKEFLNICSNMSIHSVPELYYGAYGDANLEDLRDGKSSIDGKTLKEGIVIRKDEYVWNNGNRKMLKMVSPDYLTRKNKNATEFQ